MAKAKLSTVQEKFNPAETNANPMYKREELRLYMSFDDGQTYDYLGDNVESQDIAIAVESTSTPTIAQSKPIVTNTAGGWTIPLEYRIIPGNKAYAQLETDALTGNVNKEYQFLLVHAHRDVIKGGTKVSNAIFANRGNAKANTSAFGGAGQEVVHFTMEIATTGTIEAGYMTITGNHDPETDVWQGTAFTKVTTWATGVTYAPLAIAETTTEEEIEP